VQVLSFYVSSQNLALLEYNSLPFSTHIHPQHPTATPSHTEKEHFETIAFQLRNLPKNNREVETANEKWKEGHVAVGGRVPPRIFNI
jgi:hypothetical protein